MKAGRTELRDNGDALRAGLRNNGLTELRIYGETEYEAGGEVDGKV